MLDAQYFLAGLVPSSTVGASIAVWLYAKQLPKWVVPVIGIVFFAPFISVFLVKLELSPVHWPRAAKGLVALLSLTATAIAFSIVAGRALRAKPSRTLLGQIATAFWSVLAVFYTSFLFVYYVFNVYPYLPQEVGGARPRCALLAIDGQKIGPVLQTYFSSVANPSQSGGVFTVETDVLYLSEGTIIVRPVKPMLATGGHPATMVPDVFELKREVVMAIG